MNEKLWKLMKNYNLDHEKDNKVPEYFLHFDIRSVGI